MCLQIDFVVLLQASPPLLNPRVIALVRYASGGFMQDRETTLQGAISPTDRAPICCDSISARTIADWFTHRQHSVCKIYVDSNYAHVFVCAMRLANRYNLKHNICFLLEPAQGSQICFPKDKEFGVPVQTCTCHINVFATLFSHHATDAWYTNIHIQCSIGCFWMFAPSLRSHQPISRIIYVSCLMMLSVKWLLAHPANINM